VHLSVKNWFYKYAVMCLNRSVEANNK